MTLFLFLLVPECGLRVLGLPEMAEDARFEHNSVYWSEDPDQTDVDHWHKELKVNFPVSTDANGLRAPLHGADKPAGVHRVMAMGCSTTYGWGVKDADSYPARLENHRRKQGHESVEVINAGQPGYTSFQGQWLWDKVPLSSYSPDVVLLGFIVQDSREVAYSDKSQALMQGEADFLKQNLLWRSNFYQWVKGIVGDVQIKKKDENKLVYRVSPEDYLTNLRALTAKVQATGAQPVYFGFPLEVVGYTELHRNILAAEAEAKGIPHFDPSYEMEKLSRSEELYFPQDKGHANAAGCDTIGRMMADFLVDQGLVP